MIALGLFLLFTAVRGELNSATVCQTVVMTLDCADFDVKTICASDNSEYRTECDFAKAHCQDANLKVVSEGPCSAVTTSMPQATSLATHGHSHPMGTTTNPNLSEVCNQLVNTPCSDDDSNPFCGSDGNTYLNYCEYSKGKCYNPSLTIASTGPCPTTPTTPTTTTTTTPPPSVFEIICRTLEQITCADDGVPVCGSNGVTYPSACDFEKAKCQDESLTFQDC